MIFGGLDPFDLQRLFFWKGVEGNPTFWCFCREELQKVGILVLCVCLHIGESYTNV
jgi:hypothetical protein